MAVLNNQERYLVLAKTHKHSFELRSRWLNYLLFTLFSELLFEKLTFVLYELILNNVENGLRKLTENVLSEYALHCFVFFCFWIKLFKKSIYHAPKYFVYVFYHELNMFSLLNSNCERSTAF